ncbi:hypothetical protein IPV69_15095 [Humisphaera borealis]|uniref:Uncharacterized protein n=2 Tax=Humisphaera borealis TaxID=2807512 RepID=A0A7M2WQD6_9BACT|nr:hypothetical protein IPV69_15095 [Humisphaera borealis]
MILQTWLLDFDLPKLLRHVPAGPRRRERLQLGFLEVEGALAAYVETPWSLRGVLRTCDAMAWI